MSSDVQKVQIKPDKVYTWDEVAKHNTNSSLWIVLWDQVYDLTQFAKKHPGGGNVFTSVAGKDATEVFLDAGHSREGSMAKSQFVIGVIDQPNQHPPEKLDGSCCVVQ